MTFSAMGVLSICAFSFFLCDSVFLSRLSLHICFLCVLLDHFQHTDLSQVSRSLFFFFFLALSAVCFLIVICEKGYYFAICVTETWTNSEDRHHKVCVSMSGRFTQLDASGSSTVQHISNCVPPYTASVPYPAQQCAYHTFKDGIILLVQLAVMAEFLTDSNFGV